MTDINELVAEFRKYATAVSYRFDHLDNQEELDNVLVEYVNGNPNLTVDDYDALVEHFSSYGWETS